MNTTKEIKVAICDDHPVIRYGLSQIINNEPDIHVVVEASTPEELISNFEKSKPDITILDLELNDASGIDCLYELRQSNPNAKVIIYTAHGESDQIMEAIDLGIQGYLLKQSECSDIIKSIRVVFDGGTSLEPGIATKLLARMRDDQVKVENVLSKREVQVLDLLAMGKTNRDIARTLFISERTVKFHVSSILDKLHVRNRTEAALYARKQSPHDEHRYKAV
ncbi:MAG: response regulator transcription factor [Gammaproteobacteria bacterium]|nr:response regulator transcription factor [Gammaproteobacteria bacterium]MDH5652908.1 response regulator transcription factor [Gammaproteobacteria bacterium]